jgi:hypothetical protein
MRARIRRFFRPTFRLPLPRRRVAISYVLADFQVCWRPYLVPPFVVGEKAQLGRVYCRDCPHVDKSDNFGTNTADHRDTESAEKDKNPLISSSSGNASAFFVSSWLVACLERLKFPRNLPQTDQKPLGGLAVIAVAVPNHCNGSRWRLAG